MTKQKLKEEIIKISSFGKQELDEYSQNLFISKQDIKEKAFKYLVRALDMQQSYLNKNNISPMCISSEFKFGEI